MANINIHMRAILAREWISAQRASAAAVTRGFFAAGDLKLLLLSLIRDQPRHGYDLIPQVEALFDGAYSPGSGVIYPTMAFLEAGHLVVACMEGEKKCYSITEAGCTYLTQQHVAFNGVRMRIDVSRRSLRSQGRPEEIHEAQRLHRLHSR